MFVGLVSDTHGVWDPALATHLAGVDALLHAGDVGSHGGHAAVLARLREVCPTVHAVRGNVDDDAAARRELPDSQLLTLAGWTVLLIHILADAAAAIQRHQPDIIVCGHSHQFGVEEADAPQGGVLLHVNPGSAGPARFKLKRTAALLTLPPKGALGGVDGEVGRCAGTALVPECSLELHPAMPIPTHLLLCRERGAAYRAADRAGAQGAASTARGLSAAAKAAGAGGSSGSTQRALAEAQWHWYASQHLETAKGELNF